MSKAVRFSAYTLKYKLSCKSGQMKESGFFFFFLDVFSGVRFTGGIFLGVNARRPVFVWVSRLASSPESV